MRSPEEVKRDFVRQWLKKAEEDINAAKTLLPHEMSFLFTVGFHAQQSAEKYLKAYLTWHQVEFRKTHDLGELLDIIATSTHS
jgi:HEPN domain-containing protein